MQESAEMIVPVSPQATTTRLNPAASTPALARILVVDDQPANIQVVGSVLGKLGYEIIPALDGPTALKRLAVRMPDLILLDLLMPEMDGCEVCRRLHENPDWRDLPVIFVSAADDKDLVVQALQAGAVDYITKPFHQAELVLRVKTQLDLKIARDRLKQLAEDKDELLGMLAHDLKNHLGGMQMSSELLDKRIRHLGDERAARLSNNILRSGGQLLTFVKEFLANAAAEHGIALKPVTLNFSDTAARALQKYSEAARSKQLVLDTKLPSEGAAVLADASALDQVLDNLLSNAVKFTPPGGHVVVSVHPGAGHVECRIQDDGPGFTAQDRVRMFRRYARLSARPTGGEPSSGLGLSIALKLVQAMHGELACESVPGQGARLVVRLPRPTA
jgi:two-component system, sensor histidine kinase and response regulator